MGFYLFVSNKKQLRFGNAMAASVRKGSHGWDFAM